MQTINLDISPGRKQPTCYASQFDKGRVIRINLFDGCHPYVLSAGERIQVSVRKPDQHIVTADLVNTLKEYVDLVTTLQMCACVGDCQCELRLIKTVNDEDIDIGTCDFILSVSKDPLDGGLASESEIENLQTQVNEAVEEALHGLVLGDLAWKDEAQGTYTPQGEVTGIEVTSTKKTINALGSVGSLPQVSMPTMSVSGEVLSFIPGTYIAGTLPTAAEEEVVTDASGGGGTFTGTEATITVS